MVPRSRSRFQMAYRLPKAYLHLGLGPPRRSYTGVSKAPCLDLGAVSDRGETAGDGCVIVGEDSCSVHGSRAPSQAMGVQPSRRGVNKGRSVEMTDENLVRDVRGDSLTDRSLHLSSRSIF
jgi:hypothetical protein